MLSHKVRRKTAGRGGEGQVVETQGGQSHPTIHNQEARRQEVGQALKLQGLPIITSSKAPPL